MLLLCDDKGLHDSVFFVYWIYQTDHFTDFMNIITCTYTYEYIYMYIDIYIYM